MHDFDLITGRQVNLERFNISCITSEYLSWLCDPVVVRYSNQRFKQHTQQTCLDYLQAFSTSPNLFLAIRLLGSHRLVGTMTAYVAVPHGTADIGLMIGDRSHWGKGLGLDAWQTLMSYLLSGGFVRKVTGGTLGCNIGMIRIMERSGMLLEAVRSKQQIVEDEAQDEHLYAKFRI